MIAGGCPYDHHPDNLKLEKSVHYKAYFIHFKIYDVVSILQLTINNYK